MRKITILCCLLLLALVVGQKTFAQNAGGASAKTEDSAKPAAPPIHYYQLQFVVEELGADGKPVNSRTYWTTVNTGDRNTMSIRSGSRVPVATSPVASNSVSALVNQQFTYVDVGVNIDSRDTHEVGNKLAINLTADLTGLAQLPDADTHLRVTRQNRWQATILIPVGKPTVAFASDSLDSKGSTRLMVTATLLQ
jgi:hypothetical protein